VDPTTANPPKVMIASAYRRTREIGEMIWIMIKAVWPSSVAGTRGPPLSEFVEMLWSAENSSAENGSAENGGKL
jgi:hypothetical protein